MASRRKTKSKISPGTLVFLAILAYFMNFPAWLVGVLVIGAFVLSKIQKQQKSLDHLPFPADTDPKYSRKGEAKPATQEKKAAEKVVKKKTPAPAPQTIADDRSPEVEQLLAAKAATEVPPQEDKKKQPRKANPNVALPETQHSQSLARQFKSSARLKQAIIAMTVLGPPRSQDPYRSEPQSRADISPPPAR